MARTEARITVKVADLPIVTTMAIAIAQVRLIHARNIRFPYYCVNCRAEWPCKTVRALDAIADPSTEGDRDG